MRRAASIWLLASCVMRVAAEEEEEEASDEAVGMALTLIGAVSFQMGLMHMMNHSDPDMRKYTYWVINATVSIFCAVLCFQTCNDMLEAVLLEGASQEMKFIGNWVHMFLWFTTLQVTLAFVTGAVGPTPKNMEVTEFRTKCYATLLAHVTGFASINAWGSLQQMDYFKSSYLMSFAVLPISFFGQMLLQRCSDYVRFIVSNWGDGWENEYEKKWDEEVEECENDIMGLTLSFNLTQAIRFSINGFLPNAEGGETPEQQYSHSYSQILHLFGLAIVFVIFLGLMHYFNGEGEEEEEEHHEKKTEADILNEIGLLHHDQQGAMSPTSNQTHAEMKSFSAELKERAWEGVMQAWSMGFAWCCFYSGKMWLGRFSYLQDPMQLCMGLALLVSLGSFLSIRLLDKIADASTSGKVEHAIKQIIFALSLLVGFGWEQTFDQAVESISSVTEHKHLAKVFLAVLCIVIVVPAWYYYILPMAITQNWEWGFLVADLEEAREKERWGKVISYIKKLRPSWWDDVEREAFDAIASITVAPEDGPIDGPPMIGVQSQKLLSSPLLAEHAEHLRDKLQDMARKLRDQERDLRLQKQENQALRNILSDKDRAMAGLSSMQKLNEQQRQVDVSNMEDVLKRIQELEVTLTQSRRKL